MNPETRNGGPPAPVPEKISATTTRPDPGQGNRSAAVLTAFALAILAGPGTVFDGILVPRCPLACGYAHRHYVPAGTWRQGPVVRSPRCAPSRTYEITVTAVLPDVPAIDTALTGQRRRWTA